MDTAYAFLTALEIDQGIMRTTERDHQVHAVFSYLLYWSDASVISFIDLYPEFCWLASLIAVEKRAPVYVS